MKVLISFFVVFALFGISQALKVTIHGEIENHKFIDREVVYVAAERNEYVYKGFTFPPVSFTSNINLFI